MLLQENVPLASLTTFRIGGPARFLIEAKSPEEVREGVAFARSKISRSLFWEAAATLSWPMPDGPVLS